MEFWIPYGETEVPVRVPDDNFYKILEPPRPTKPHDLLGLVKRALDNPVDDVSLASIVKPGGHVAIIVDPMVPAEASQITLEELRSRFDKLGASSTKIFLRRRTSNTPLPESSGAANGPVILDPLHGSYSELGRTTFGTLVSVRQDLLDCETKICLSLVMPHFASGFSGGPEAILPGASSPETISQNRSLLVRGLPSPAEFGNNPLLRDSFEACKLVGPLYNIAFIPDGSGYVDSAFAGDLDPVFKEATSRFLQAHTREIDRKPDVLIVSAGAATSMDLYHAVRVLPNVSEIVKREGTIILVAECPKGVGDSTFLDYSSKFDEKKSLLSDLRRHFRLGGHVSLLLREALDRNRLELVSVLPDHYARDMFKLKPSRTASAAVQQAIRVEGKDSKILIVTRGELTIPSLAEMSGHEN